MSSESPRVAIADYGMGNLYSVQRACEAVGLEGFLADSADAVRSAAGVILPGVGAMPVAMAVLHESGLSSALVEAAARVPFMGICLGMQLLMDYGCEFGQHAGLGIVRGSVRRFADRDEEGHPVRVPHIGWSRPTPTSPDRWRGTLLEGVPEAAQFYFVHSYYAEPADPEVMIATSCYAGQRFCAALQRDNLFACQFHPERSASQGLVVYSAFAAMVRERWLLRKKTA